MVEFYLAGGDRLPSFKVTLLTPAGTPVDLTTATSIVFSMQIVTGANAVITGAAVVVGSPTLGVVQYNWGASDTVVPGDYNAEWVVTFGGGLQMTFPNNRTELIRIRARV